MEEWKAGLDHRAYNFEKIRAAQYALWRSHDCREHGGGYEDIVYVFPTAQNIARMLSPCCLEPINDAAHDEFWRQSEAKKEAKP
jgi:hypothetical protein